MKIPWLIYFLSVFAIFQQIFVEQTSGAVIGWGSNLAGEATGTPSITFTTNRVEFIRQVTNTITVSTGAVNIAGQSIEDTMAISAGCAHGLALRKDGTVVGWGWNIFGQATGVPTGTGLNVAGGPVIVSGQVLTNVIAMAAGRTHSIALKEDGTVVTWGTLNSGRKIETLTNVSNIVAVAAGWDCSLGLRSNGTLAGWNMRIPEGLSNVIAIAASREFGEKNLALRNDGTVVEWYNRGGSMNMVHGLSNVVVVASGANHSLALKKDGTVFGWGDNSCGQATGVPTKEPPYSATGLVRINGQLLTNAISISAGNEFSLALKSDGTVLGWGRLPAPVPADLSSVTAIAAGDDFCLAITTNNAIAEKFLQK